MFARIIPILLLTIHQGQCAMQAIANVQLNSTSISIGNITFTQNDANSPVMVMGTLTVPNASNLTHVCRKILQLKKISCSVSLPRVFTFILWQSLKRFQIVQQL